MKFSFTKSKVKMILAGIVALMTILVFVIPGAFVYHKEMWFLIPISFFLELVVLAMLLFDIRVGTLANRIMTGIAIVIFPFISMQTIEILQKSFYFPTFKSYAVNYLMFLALYILTALISTRIKYAVLVCAPLSFIIGLINYYVVLFRGTPLQPWDFAAAKTAMNVVDNFTFSIDEYVLFSFILNVFIILYACIMQKEQHTHKIRMILMGIRIVVLIVAVAIPSYMIVNYRRFFYSSVWKPSKNGYVTNFLINMQLMDNNPPENYSLDNVEAILQNFESDEIITEDLPNIIVVMNESFADFNSINEFVTDTDYMPFIRSLSGKENVVSGNLHVSIYGGGTSNTEYEFLTSNVCSMLRSGSYPMMQFVINDSISLVSNLKSLGYKTIGVHPYYASGWNRSGAYPLLGFDDFITIEEFDEEQDTVRKYISDEACYDRIIEESENAAKQDQPLFLFAVTMQNHGGYLVEWEDQPNDVTFQNEDKYPKLSQYLELAHITDIATERLISYYQQQERDTIILFFGDHQPHLGEEYEELFAFETYTPQNHLKRYTTPFFIWANFDIEEEQISNISPNYLGPLLLEKANLPQTAYYKYMNEMRKTLTTITTAALIDANGEYFAFDTIDQSKYSSIMNEYDIVQYNNVIDENKLTDKFVYRQNDSR